MRWLSRVLVVVLIGGLLMALVASHGCSVEGSSPVETDASHIIYNE